jgi:hypothetical protein
MTWRVAVLDSGWNGAAVHSARFELGAMGVLKRTPVEDRLGHGTRVTGIIARASRAPEFVIAQVLDARGISSPAVVAAAIHWAIECQSHLIHLSLGLASDRATLREAIAAAITRRIIIVASTPARGEDVFPASYPAVLRATGDARCVRDDISHLGPSRFGGAPVLGRQGGASIGAAHVTRAVVNHCIPGDNLAEIETVLTSNARFHGHERR